MLVRKKVVPLHPQFKIATRRLGYGVMVTLQILVLPFLVRVRVPQQSRRGYLKNIFFFYLYILEKVAHLTHFMRFLACFIAKNDVYLQPRCYYCPRT